MKKSNLLPFRLDRSYANVGSLDIPRLIEVAASEDVHLMVRLRQVGSAMRGALKRKLESVYMVKHFHDIAAPMFLHMCPKGQLEELADEVGCDVADLATEGDLANELTEGNFGFSEDDAWDRLHEVFPEMMKPEAWADHVMGCLTFAPRKWEMTLKLKDERIQDLLYAFEQLCAVYEDEAENDLEEGEELSFKPLFMSEFSEDLAWVSVSKEEYWDMRIAVLLAHKVKALRIKAENDPDGGGTPGGAAQENEGATSDSLDKSNTGNYSDDTTAEAAQPAPLAHNPESEPKMTKLNERSDKMSVCEQFEPWFTTLTARMADHATRAGATEDEQLAAAEIGDLIEVSSYRAVVQLTMPEGNADDLFAMMDRVGNVVDKVVGLEVSRLERAGKAKDAGEWEDLHGEFTSLLETIREWVEEASWDAHSAPHADEEQLSLDPAWDEPVVAPVDEARDPAWDEPVAAVVAPVPAPVVAPEVRRTLAQFNKQGIALSGDAWVGKGLVDDKLSDLSCDSFDLHMFNSAGGQLAPRKGVSAVLKMKAVKNAKTVYPLGFVVASYIILARRMLNGEVQLSAADRLFITALHNELVNGLPGARYECPVTQMVLAPETPVWASDAEDYALSPHAGFGGPTFLAYTKPTQVAEPVVAEPVVEDVWFVDGVAVSPDEDRAASDLVTRAAHKAKLTPTARDFDNAVRAVRRRAAPVPAPEVAVVAPVVAPVVEAVSVPTDILNALYQQLNMLTNAVNTLTGQVSDLTGKVDTLNAKVESLEDELKVAYAQPEVRVQARVQARPRVSAPVSRTAAVLRDNVGDDTPITISNDAPALAKRKYNAVVELQQTLTPANGFNLVSDARSYIVNVVDREAAVNALTSLRERLRGDQAKLSVFNALVALLNSADGQLWKRSSSLEARGLTQKQQSLNAAVAAIANA